MASLYEINQDILACIDMETGEIVEPEKLEQLQMDRTEKIRNIACYIKNLRADAKAYDEEAKVFAERKQRALRRADGLAEYLNGQLAGEKVKGKEFSISYRKSEPLEIDDDADIPDEFLVAQAPKPDKTAIKKALRCGAVMHGVRIVEKRNIQIK